MDPSCCVPTVPPVVGWEVVLLSLVTSDIDEERLSAKESP